MSEFLMKHNAFVCKFQHEGVVSFGIWSKDARVVSGKRFATELEAIDDAMARYAELRAEP
jgi:hypothetical protein